MPPTQVDFFAPRGRGGIHKSIADLIDASGDCWKWLGSRGTSGYGKLKHRDLPTEMAHRAVWFALVGPLPDELTIDHLCRNRLCVNPDHMEPVTRAENTRRRPSNWSPSRPPMGICPIGHDKTVLGRGTDGRCMECRRLRRRQSPSHKAANARWRAAHPDYFKEWRKKQKAQRLSE
jgi:hypothetical protein